eukprot:4840698-Amphidinium_carterae.1
MQAGNHTFAIPHKPRPLALFKCPDSSQELSSSDGLLQPRKGQPDTHSSVRKVANTTSPEMRIAAMTPRHISPHSMNARPGNQSRLMVDNNLTLRNRKSSMKPDTRRRLQGGGRKLNLLPLSRPSKTVMHNVLQVLSSFTTTNTS